MAFLRAGSLCIAVSGIGWQWGVFGKVEEREKYLISDV